MSYVYNNTTPFIQTSFNYSSATPSSPTKKLFCWYYENKDQPFTLIIISIWLSLALPAIYCLYTQVRSDRVIPVFIINLLLADILQICCMIVNVAWLKSYVAQYIIVYYFYNCGVIASVFFITFIAMERYLLIAWPLWYRFSRTLKVSASVSAVSWSLSIFIGFISGTWLGVLLALPLPLFIFFLVRTLKALSKSHNVPSDEKRQIVAVLTVVTFSYTLTFLPQIFKELLWSGLWWDYDDTTDINFTSVSCTLIQISPVTNLLLYILIKKWVLDKLLTFLCCCRKTNDVHQQTNSITTTTSTWSASQRQTEAENNP